LTENRDYLRIVKDLRSFVYTRYTTQIPSATKLKGRGGWWLCFMF